MSRRRRSVPARGGGGQEQKFDADSSLFLFFVVVCLPETDSVCSVYEELHQAVASIDEQEDLRWWRNTHGPGMPTDWPHFQVTPNHTAAAVARWAEFNSSKNLSFYFFFPLKEWMPPPKKNKKQKKEVVEKTGTIEKRWAEPRRTEGIGLAVCLNSLPVLLPPA